MYDVTQLEEREGKYFKVACKTAILEYWGGGQICVTSFYSCPKMCTNLVLPFVSSATRTASLPEVSRPGRLEPGPRRVSIVVVGPLLSTDAKLASCRCCRLERKVDKAPLQLLKIVESLFIF